MLRKVFLIGIFTLVVAVPAQANQGKELRISGPVVRASAQAVSVENRVGDAMLTCTVPARLAEKVAALEGRRQGAHGLRSSQGPPGRAAHDRAASATRPRSRARRRTRVDEKKSEEKRGEKQMAAGQVAELASGRDRRPVGHRPPRVQRPG